MISISISLIICIVKISLHEKNLKRKLQTEIFWNMYDRQMANNLYTEGGLSNSKKNKNHPI